MGTTVLETYNNSPINVFKYYKTKYTHVKRKEIWWADLDGVGSEQQGRKPVLIIQNNIGNTYSPTTIIAPLSTKTHKKLPTHVLLKAEECGIPEDSIVLLEQIKVIDKSRLKSKITVLTDKKMNEIDSALLISVGLKAV